MFASLVTRTPRQTELTAVSRRTPDTTVTATPTVTDREHDGRGGGGWWMGIKTGVHTSGTILTRECKFVNGICKYAHLGGQMTAVDTVHTHDTVSTVRTHTHTHTHTHTRVTCVCVSLCVCLLPMQQTCTYVHTLHMHSPKELCSSVHILIPNP